MYLIISYREIDWSRFLEPRYFNYIMSSGFVFYGGLIGGLLCFLFAGKFHHINSKLYITHLIFLIPWIHGFGRIGCFLAGCCYGIPYDGPFAVQFPEGSLAPSDTTLFPVQLVEAICLLILAIVLAVLDLKKSYPHIIAIYFIVYGILRFLLEYVRYDAVRGHLLALSTSQWISLGFVVGTVCYLIRAAHKQKERYGSITGNKNPAIWKFVLTYFPYCRIFINLNVLSKHILSCSFQSFITTLITVLSRFYLPFQDLLCPS